MCQGNNKPAKLIAFNRKARAKLPNNGTTAVGRGEGQSPRQDKSVERRKFLGQLVEYSNAGSR